MNLLDTLAAGVRGAAGGTATVKLRASATAAPVYADHARTVRRWGTLTLDANGGTTAYVEDVVDISVYDIAGALLRSWTEGEASTCVEVISPALTGADYATATPGVDRPITLSAALAKVTTSFGSTDWNVTGSAVSLQAAFAGMSGMFFDVTAYGAVGDGTTDDYLSIQRAIDTASTLGGTVWFPAGTYQVEYLLGLPGNVSLLGPGSNVAAIRQAGGSDLPVIVATGGYDAHNSISGLHITTTLSTGTAGDAFGLLNISNGCYLTVRDCRIGGPLCYGATVWVSGGSSYTEVRLERCQLTAGGTNQNGLTFGRCLNSAEGVGARITATECTFESPSSCSTLDGIILVYGLCIHLRSCYFDCSTLTTGDVICFTPRVTSTGESVTAYNSLDGCTFSAGGGTDPAYAILALVASAADWFYESGTILNSLTPAYHVRQGTDARMGETAFGTALYYCKKGSVGYYAEETEPASDDVTPTLGATQTTVKALDCSATTKVGDNRLRFDGAYAVCGQHVTVHCFGVPTAGSLFYGPGSFGEPDDGMETVAGGVRYSAPGLNPMIGSKFFAYRMTFMRTTSYLTGRWLCTDLGADISGPYNAAFGHDRRSY